MGRLEPSGFRAALDRLGALSDTAGASARWWHWITRLDDTGRVMLPPLAQAVSDRSGLVRVSSRGDAVLLCRDGVGVPTTVDGRGRVRLPEWMRHRVGAGGAVHLAARRPDASTVVVAPGRCLDVIADAFAGEVA